MNNELLEFKFIQLHKQKTLLDRRYEYLKQQVLSNCKKDSVSQMIAKGEVKIKINEN